MSSYWRSITKKDPCVYCGAPGPSTLDHIIPKYHGGHHRHWTNLAGACERCNVSKGTLSVLGFMLRRRGINNHIRSQRVLPGYKPEGFVPTPIDLALGRPRVRDVYTVRPTKALELALLSDAYASGMPA